MYWTHKNIISSKACMYPSLKFGNSMILIKLHLNLVSINALFNNYPRHMGMMAVRYSTLKGTSKYMPVIHLDLSPSEVFNAWCMLVWGLYDMMPHDVSKHWWFNMTGDTAKQLEIILAYQSHMSEHTLGLGLHMGPDNLCYIMSHVIFYFFLICHNVTLYMLYKTLTSLSTVL